MRTHLRARHLLLLALLFAIPAVSFAQVSVGVAIHIGPPAIPVYTQPPCPEEGLLWTPGYWAYGPAGYYWVPGVWVAPPQAGVLWTPGYWGFVGGAYGWHAGYWGPHVGFYGGINYGFGYGGVGFYGGRWEGEHFRYNTAVVVVNRTVVHNVYEDRTVIRNTTVVNRASFNGEGGVRARPTNDERVAMHEQHFQPTSTQYSHQRSASQDHGQWASENHGNPHNMAMGSVNERQNRQQQRIANGVRSGQMTPHETAHVEHQEAGIHHEVHNDRAANGGTLTPQEHHQVEHQQNHVSHEIHDDKHNDQHDERDGHH
ncbi:MAG TPA: YXWGXW repeat-containing protein [Candidatus Acidoferrales bacterium]|nr:YXWGXW repeat-containing protein [Candidatus Acidoferrales bacterium]